MPNHAEPTAQYPHQLQEEVTQGDLAVHMAEHPEMYHDGLTPHINRVLGQVVSEVTASVEEHSDQDIPDRRQEARDWLKASGIVYEKSDDDDSWIGLPTIDTVQVPQDLASDIALVLIEDGDPTDVLFDAKTFPKLDRRVANAFIDGGGYFAGAVIEEIERYPGLHLDASAAMRIIAAKCAGSVFDNAGLFEGFTPTLELAESLLPTQAHAVLRRIDMFPGLRQKINADTTQMLINTQQYDALLENRAIVPGVPNSSEFIDELIDKKHLATVLRNLEYFTGYDPLELATRAIEINCTWAAMFADKFPTELHKDIAQKLLTGSVDGEYTLVDSLDKFSGISQAEAFDMIIQNGGGRTILYKLEKFDQLDVDHVLLGLAKTDKAREVMHYIRDKTDVNPEIAYALLDSDIATELTYYIGNFKDLDQQRVANTYLESGNFDCVLRIVGRNSGLLDQVYLYDLALRAADTGQARHIMLNIDRIPGLELNGEFAKRVVVGGGAADYMMFSHMFKNVECDADFVESMIRQGQGSWVLLGPRTIDANLQFTDESVHMLLDPAQEISLELFAQNLAHFTRLPDGTAKLLIDAGQANAVLVNREKFSQDPDFKLDLDMARSIIKSGQSWVLFDNAQLFDGLRLDSSDVAELLSSNPSGLAENVGMFSGTTPNEIAYALIDAGKPHLVLSCIDNFPDFPLDNAYMAHLINTHNDIEMAVNNLDMFVDIDRNELAAQLASKTPAHMDILLRNASKFPDFEFDLNIAQRALSTVGAAAITDNLAVFSKVDSTELANELISSGYSVAVLKNNQHFPGIRLDSAFAQKLIESDFWARRELIARIGDFEVEPSAIAEQFCATGAQAMVLTNKAAFPDYRFSFSQATKLIESSNEGSVMDHIDRFDLSLEQQAQINDVLIDLFATKDLGMINLDQFTTYFDSLAPGSRSEPYDQAKSLFGSLISQEGLSALLQLNRGIILPELQQLGVVDAGTKGIEQFGTIAKSFIDQVRDPAQSDAVIRAALESPLLRGVLKQSVRLAEASWGNKTDAHMLRLLQYTQTATAEGRIVPMPEQYTPSEVVHVKTSLSSKYEKAQWTSDILQRYRTLTDELYQVSNLFGDLQTTQANSTVKDKKAVADRLLDDLTTGVRQIVNNLYNDINDEYRKNYRNAEGKATKGPLSDKGKQAIRSKIDALEAMLLPPDPVKPDRTGLRSLAKFEQNFANLSEYSDLHPQMRKLMFLWALRKNGVDTSANIDLAGSKDLPSIDEVSELCDFVDHIVNQETYSKYFTNQKNLDAFKRITSVRALQDALKIAQASGGDSNVTTPLQFVPTRGIMMEFSGHIGDACWASKYDSIAESLPNMTAVIMKQYPGDPQKEKLMGSAMLIETTNPTTKQPVLVIRGLNPLDKTINSLSVEGFYEAFTGYARAIAEKRGMQLGIVIDDHAGGSASNRPVLWGFLAGKKSSLKRLPVNGADTLFNGYNITNDVYAL